MDRGKNILYISRSMIPSETSNSLSIMRVCQALADAGHVVTLTGRSISSPRNSNPIVYYGLRGGFRVIVFHLNNIFKARLLSRLMLDGIILAFKNKGIIKDIKPDIIYSRLTLFELFFVPSDIPVIYEMHSLGYLGSNKLFKKLFLYIFKQKNIKRIIVTTNYLREELKKVFTGIDIRLAPLSAEEPIKIKKNDISKFYKFHLKGKNFKKHVGYTGFLDNIGLRGTDIICQIAAEMPKIAFHIVGGNAEMVEYWKDYAKVWNKNKNIFFYGYRNPNEMVLFLNIFIVALAPLQCKISRRAPIGNNMSPLKIPQYMSYGKAIVASDIPSHRELLTNGENALLVPADDVKEWVRAIKTLLDNPDYRNKLGKNARKKYYQYFTPEKRVETILQGL